MEHWRAFGPEWFARQQGALLWLLRAPLIGRWFRWCLRIRACDIGHAREIIEIRPHCYTVAGDEPETFISDFRTHWKYSKRLYYAFRPLWWALHWWDALIAEPFIPRWSFGFPTIERYPDPDPETTTVDGYCYRIVVSESWTALRTGGGNSAVDSVENLSLTQMESTATTDEWTQLRRAVLLFDTSALSDSAISAATLTVTGNSKTDSLGIAPSLVVVSSNPASNTGLVGADFSTFGASAFSDVISYSAFDAAGPNIFSLNAAGLAAIAPTSITKLGVINYNYDFLDTPPTWSASAISGLGAYAAERTGLTQDPKLTVTYSWRNVILPPNRMRPAVFSPGIAR